MRVKPVVVRAVDDALGGVLTLPTLAGMPSPRPEDMPRERLLTLGPAALSDVELVAIQLGTGRRGESVHTLAGTLLDAWGGVSGLARAEVAELALAPGVGPAKACRLVAAFALAERVGPRDGQLIRSSADIAAVVMPRIGRARTEQVLLLVLDGSHRVCRVLTVTSGGASASALAVRDVLALALRHDAVALALAHNHPGGDPTPSERDVRTTVALRAAAEQVGLRFLDHVVVAGAQWRSVTAWR